jgi:hypothetical protein
MASPLDPICLFRTLNEHSVDYVLIGGLGAVLHGSTAVTNDADIVPSREPANLTKLGAALRALEARIRSIDNPDGLEFDPHPELLSGMAMLNMTTRCGDLDLTFSPAGLDDFDEISSRAVAFDIEGIVVRVAALGDIIRSKQVADRPKDRAVLPILHALADELHNNE